MELPDGEPEAGPWRVVPLQELVELMLAAAGSVKGHPAIIAIDGRGGSGKSTLARALQRCLPESAVIHTDDLSWYEPLFEWGHLLADDVLRPLHRGDALDYRPPQWEQRGRDGAITVPADTSVVLVEGNGASHLEHADLVDATVWVQTDMIEARRRGLIRDVEEGVNGEHKQAAEFWDWWMTAELPFFDRQQPWYRACVIVNGAPDQAPEAGRVLVAPAFTGST